MTATKETNRRDHIWDVDRNKIRCNAVAIDTKEKGMISVILKLINEVRLFQKTVLFSGF